jgi:hypothetical protein
MLGAITAAAALAGAAVFTVSQAACPDPGHYVSDGVTLQVVGGCVGRDELPNTGPAEAQGNNTVHGALSRP